MDVIYSRKRFICPPAEALTAFLTDEDLLSRPASESPVNTLDALVMLMNDAVQTTLPALDSTVDLSFEMDEVYAMVLANAELEPVQRDRIMACYIGTLLRYGTLAEANAANVYLVALRLAVFLYPGLQTWAANEMSQAFGHIGEVESRRAFLIQAKTYGYQTQFPAIVPLEVIRYDAR